MQCLLVLRPADVFNVWFKRPQATISGLTACSAARQRGLVRCFHLVEMARGKRGLSNWLSFYRFFYFSRRDGEGKLTCTRTSDPSPVVRMLRLNQLRDSLYQPAKLA